MCIHTPTPTNTDTYACIPMRAQCICMHPWCHSCIHVYMYIPTHTHNKKPVNKIQTQTCMPVFVCTHSACTHGVFSYIEGKDVHTHTHTYKPRYVYTYLYMHTLLLYAPTVSFHIHICIHIYTHTHMYKNRHVCMHLYARVHICKYMHTHMWIWRTCMSIHAYIHVNSAYTHL